MATNNDKETATDTNNTSLPQYDEHVLFTYINQWENHSIAKIQLTADQARNELKEIFQQKHQIFTDILNEINKEISSNPCSTINPSKWLEQLDKIRQDLANLSTCIHLEHDKSESPIYLIKLCHKNKPSIKITTENLDNGDEINVPGTVPLSSTELHNAPVAEQKQLLGERLFPLVQQIEPRLAAKITGMFIELDVKHILKLIRSEQTRKEKIKEALKVLKDYQYNQLHV